MRPLREILDEVHRICLDNNCQSWPIIAVEAMKAALKEFRDDIEEEMERLEKIAEGRVGRPSLK